MPAFSLPRPGPLVPRRRYGPMRVAGLLWMRVSGWRIDGELPDLARLVVAVAPHSSAWDVAHALAAVFALDLRASFLGKHTLFAGPLAPLLRWLGAIPVDRSNPAGVVDAAAARLRESDGMWLGLAPEGTRRAGASFKSGFYRIAAAAGVPILPVFIDYRGKRIGVLPPVAADRPVDEGVAKIRELLAANGCRRDER